MKETFFELLVGLVVLVAVVLLSVVLVGLVLMQPTSQCINGIM